MLVILFKSLSHDKPLSVSSLGVYSKPIHSSYLIEKYNCNLFHLEYLVHYVQELELIEYVLHKLQIRAINFFQNINCSFNYTHNAFSFKDLRSITKSIDERKLSSIFGIAANPSSLGSPLGAFIKICCTLASVFACTTFSKGSEYGNAHSTEVNPDLAARLYLSKRQFASWYINDKLAQNFKFILIILLSYENRLSPTISRVRIEFELSTYKAGAAYRRENFDYILSQGRKYFSKTIVFIVRTTSLRFIAPLFFFCRSTHKISLEIVQNPIREHNNTTHFNHRLQ
ncbi:hypothetical protein AGLY_013887 [Aphis glycines]|uniref:Uncharacterized protein n=1 Tax=Aphis glycines TaxID=307491 RepID=A0A6G0T604_APHGL|nr:hypothetical protein AGLY_013887 [Aphis glycines]